MRSGKRRRVGPNEKVLRGDGADLAGQHHEVVDRGLFRSLDDCEAGADMQRQHHVLVRERLQHGVPVARQEAREALHVRRLEEADGPAALLGHPVHLGHRRVDVPHGHDAQWNESTGIRTAPFVDGPVVVCLQHDQGDLLVARLGERTGVPPGHGREAHGTEHSVGIHVAHALVHVETTRAQLGVGTRIEAPLLAGPADRGRHAERGRRLLALELPLVDAVLVHDLRRLGQPLLRDVILVHVRRFDHVVVDADQNHVVEIHGVFFSSVMTPNAGSAGHETRTGRVSQPRTLEVWARQARS